MTRATPVQGEGHNGKFVKNNIHANEDRYSEDVPSVTV